MYLGKLHYGHVGNYYFSCILILLFSLKIDDGKIESLTPQSVPVTDIIVETLDIASTVQESTDNKY